MSVRKLFTAFVTLAAALTANGLVTTSAAAESAPAFLTPGDATEAPRGFTEMCGSLPGLCAGFAQPAMMQAAVAGDAGEAGIEKAIGEVNRHVNFRVHQQSDMATYGVAELWRPAGDGARAAGDCEDIALEKRIELIAAHVPADRLFLAVVFAKGAGLHTVLVARMAHGDVVLDSRSPFILPWSRTGYSWLSIETPGQPMQWRVPGEAPAAAGTIASAAAAQAAKG